MHATALRAAARETRRLEARLSLSRGRLAARTLPHGQRPTRCHLAVLEQKARHPDVDTPTHRTIAGWAGVCIRTVGNALRRLAHLGLLTWTKRATVLPDGTVWRLANRYAFLNSLFFLFAPPPQRKEKEEELFIINPLTLVGKLPPDELLALRCKWGLA